MDRWERTWSDIAGALGFFAMGLIALAFLVAIVRLIIG